MRLCVYLLWYRLSLYCTVIYWLRMCINHSTWWLPVGATPHTGVEPCVRPKTIVVGFPRIVIIRLLALAKTGRRFTAPEWVHVHQVGKAKPCKRYNTPITHISQVYILPLWISDHLHEKIKNLNRPFLVSETEFNGMLVYLNIFHLWWPTSESP